MNHVMLLVSVAYVVIVFVITRMICLQLMATHQLDLENVQAEYQRCQDRRQALIPDKQVLADRAHELFMLYDMTREITKSFDENAAFTIFMEKLHENLSFEDCRLIHPLSEEVKTLKATQDYYLYTLMGKARLLGYLAVKGVDAKDMEKLNILANQFSLALRRIRLYQAVEKLAITDSLTELHTRRHILERFEEEIRRSRARHIHLSFLMLDVDYFKKTNDRYGHLAGDQVLREIARLIHENVREIDIVGRYGGEEFCVVLPDTDQHGAHYVAQRIREAVERTTIKAYDATVRSTVSIGLATYPDNGRTREELLERADHALYQAKEKGRNQVCLYERAKS